MRTWKVPPADPSAVWLESVGKLEPEADRGIRNQHVVSKVLLKGFAAPGATRLRLAVDSV
jgi:hypothetical protein